MTEKEKKEIIRAYQTSGRSIQDIARIFRVSVEEVLELIGESRAASVESTGDLVDQAEAGPNATLKTSEKIKVPFSTN